MFISNRVDLKSDGDELFKGRIKAKWVGRDTYNIYVLKTNGKWHKVTRLNKENTVTLLVKASEMSRTNVRVFCTENRKSLLKQEK